MNLLVSTTGFTSNAQIRRSKYPNILSIKNLAHIHIAKTLQYTVARL